MKKRYIIIAAIVLSVWGYCRIGVMHVDYLIAHLAYPGIYLIRAISDVGKQWWQRRRSIDELVAALAESQENIMRLSQEVIELKSARIYLDELRELRIFRYRYTTDWMVSAQVIGKIISPDAHIIILDRGQRHGIVRDMVAVYHDGIVGRVSDVYPWWCKVTLVSDRLSKIPVICAATKTTGIFEGMNEPGVGTLSYVSHLLPLQEGDLITTSGDGLIYPRGFAVGHISSVYYDADTLQYRVAVKCYVEARDLHMCYIIARGSEYDITKPLAEDQETLRIADIARAAS